MNDCILLRALFADAEILETLESTCDMAQMLGHPFALAQASELSGDTCTLRQDATPARLFYEAASIHYQMISSTEHGHGQLSSVSKSIINVSNY